MDLHTKRLYIRDFSFCDDMDFYEMCSNVNTSYLAGWKPHPNIEVTRNIIAAHIYQPDTYVIILKETGEFIGTISLYENEKRDVTNRELGFCLNKRFRKQGYMNEACKAMIEYAFKQLKIEILLTEHATFNIDCENVIKKLPFKYEGCLRKERKLFDGTICDCKVYSIIKEEYEEEIK